MTTTTVDLSAIEVWRGSYSSGVIEPDPTPDDAGGDIDVFLNDVNHVDTSLPLTIEVDIYATATSTYSEVGFGSYAANGDSLYTYLGTHDIGAVTAGHTETVTYALPTDAPSEWATALSRGDVWLEVFSYGYLRITAIRLTQDAAGRVGFGWSWRIDMTPDVNTPADSSSSGAVLGVVSTSVPEPVLVGGAPS